MDEGQIIKGNGGKGKGKTIITIVAVVAVIVVVIVAVLLSGLTNIAGSKDGNRLITKANEDLVMDLSDLPSGWVVNISYKQNPDVHEDNVSAGIARYNHTVSTDPLMVEIVTIQIYRVNTTEEAIEVFAQNFAEVGWKMWQAVPLATVGNVSVGDEAVLCSGNWTGSHAAIKTLIFRENNVIVLLVYEATENMNLSNNAVIEMGALQDAKLLA